METYNTRLRSENIAICVDDATGSYEVRIQGPAVGAYLGRDEAMIRYNTVPHSQPPQCTSTYSSTKFAIDLVQDYRADIAKAADLPQRVRDGLCALLEIPSPGY